MHRRAGGWVWLLACPSGGVPLGVTEHFTHASRSSQRQCALKCCVRCVADGGGHPRLLDLAPPRPLHRHSLHSTVCPLDPRPPAAAAPHAGCSKPSSPAGELGRAPVPAPATGMCRSDAEAARRPNAGPPPSRAACRRGRSPGRSPAAAGRGYRCGGLEKARGAPRVWHIVARPQAAALGGGAGGRALACVLHRGLPSRANHRRLCRCAQQRASSACGRAATPARCSGCSSRWCVGRAPPCDALPLAAGAHCMRWDAGIQRSCMPHRLRPAHVPLGRACNAQAPPTPPVDPENEEFVIFVRSKKVRRRPPQWQRRRPPQWQRRRTAWLGVRRSCRRLRLAWRLAGRRQPHESARPD